MELVKEDKKEHFMCQYSVFFMENMKMKGKQDKKFDLPNGDLNP